MLETLLRQIKEQKKRLKLTFENKEPMLLLSPKHVHHQTKVFLMLKRLTRKRFFVEIDEKTGLIRKWKLKNRRPKKQGVGGTRSEATVKQLKPDEFRQILSRLLDQFSSKDVLNALIRSGLGVRKLQPTFGNINKGMFCEYSVEKVPGADKGLGVRYRKVN